MARILHIGQKVENFQAFESAMLESDIEPKAFSSMLKRDRSVEKATVRILYKLNERLKYT